MAVLMLLALITAACGSTYNEGKKNLPASDSEKVSSENKKENDEENKEEAKTEESEKEAAVPAVTVNNAKRYLEDLPILTEDILTLNKISYNFISTNPELFPATTKEAVAKVKKLTDKKVTSKHLNKNVEPYLEKIINFTGDVIQIEEHKLDDGTPVTTIILDDMDFNAIYALGYQTTDILEGDFIDIWGLPLGQFQYDNIDGGTTLAQVIATSYIE